jgi:hypothetical protein
MFKSALFALSAVAFAVPALGAQLAPMALNGYSTVPKMLATAVVFDQNNYAVGIVKKIDTDAAGRPVSVVVLMPGGAIRQVSADQAGYDPITNQVVVDDSRSPGVQVAARAPAP